MVKIGRRTASGGILAVSLGLLSCGSSGSPVTPEASLPVTAADLLSPAQVRADVDQFEAELEGRFAYLRANGADYESAIEALRERGRNGMSVYRLGIELDRILGLFIDGHAVVDYEIPAGYLPFRLEAIGERAVAVQAERLGFVEAGHPYLSRIDGKTLAEWRDLLGAVLPRGSPQFRNARTVAYLHYIQFSRDVAGQERAPVVRVDLASPDGSSTVSRALEVADRLNGTRRWPDTSSHLMEGDIGYLRIGAWDDAAFAEVAGWMPRFHGARGLIVDIRHNGGGTRNVLRDLYPHFVEESHPPRVAGAAKYRLYSQFGPDHLEGRNMHRLDWSGWTAAERAALAAFVAGFEPEWRPPESEFSDWHFWVLTKASKPDAPFFAGPIVFLMDQDCFSASDVILSSVKGMPNVTLIGEPSGGGSGAPVETTLRNSRMTLYLSSMASFQQSGQLFDGRGVHPDLLVEPSPEFYLRGGKDRALEAAIEKILG